MIYRIISKTMQSIYQMANVDYLVSNYGKESFPICERAFWLCKQQSLDNSEHSRCNSPMIPHSTRKTKRNYRKCHISLLHSFWSRLQIHRKERLHCCDTQHLRQHWTLRLAEHSLCHPQFPHQSRMIYSPNGCDICSVTCMHLSIMYSIPWPQSKAIFGTYSNHYDIMRSNNK